MLDVLLQYDDVTIANSRKIVIRTDDDRIDTLNKLEKELVEGEYVKQDPGSSIGCIVMESCRIYVKPLTFPGIQNELNFVERINQYVANGGSTLRFDRSIIRNVTGAVHVGSKRPTKNEKADVHIVTTDKIIPISIKMDNASRWASVDVMYGNEASDLLEIATADGSVDVVPHSDEYAGDVFRVDRPIARKMRRDEINKVVFGSDVKNWKNRGFILVKTFTESNFIERNGTLHIDGTVLKNADDVIDTDYHPYLTIRNDAARRSKTLPPGLRVEVIYNTKITSNTVLIGPRVENEHQK